MKEVTLVTDGGCYPNPGTGGWAYILRYKDAVKEAYGSEHLTTNNRMELRAIIEGLKAIKFPCKVNLISDSEYVLNGVRNWIGEGGKICTYGRGKTKKIKNLDLWLELTEAARIHTLAGQWIKGHSGYADNEKCDVLATLARTEATRLNNLENAQ